MKLTVASLIATGLFLGSLALADDGRIFDGTPVLSRAVPLHVQGKPVTAQLIVAERSGHNIHLDQPELVVDAIRQIVMVGS